MFGSPMSSSQVYIVWTAPQRVTGHMSIGHEPNSSGSGGVSIRSVITYLRGLLFILVIYTFCRSKALRPSNFEEVLVTPLLETACSYL